MTNATTAIPALARHSSLAALEATILASRGGESGADPRASLKEVQALALQATAAAALCHGLLGELASTIPSAASLEVAGKDLARLGQGAEPLLDAARALGERSAAMLLGSDEARPD